MKLPKELSFKGLKVGSREYRRMANKRYYYRHKQSEKNRTKEFRANNPEWVKEYQTKNKERIRANARKCEYGLSNEEFKKRLEEQNGRCALCVRKLKNPDVDHDHRCCSQRYTCGKCTRGLLCHGCNTALGLFKESSDILKRAVQYLNYWKVRHNKENQ